MVGYENRYPDISQAEEERCQEKSGEATDPDHISQDTMEEKKSIEGTEHQQTSHQKLGAVHGGESFEYAVEPRQRVHGKGQQWMAYDIVSQVPVGEHAVGDGVKSRHVVVAHKHTPRVLTVISKQREEFRDDQILVREVEGQRIDRRPSLFSSDH